MAPIVPKSIIFSKLSWQQRRHPAQPLGVEHGVHPEREVTRLMERINTTHTLYYAELNPEGSCCAEFALRKRHHATVTRLAQGAE